MPQLLRIGPYIIYFWSNENTPLEPIHVYAAKGHAAANATKLRIASNGKALLCNNNSQIPERVLQRVIRLIEANSNESIEAWLEHFGEIRYYC